MKILFGFYGYKYINITNYMICNVYDKNNYYTQGNDYFSPGKFHSTLEKNKK